MACKRTAMHFVPASSWQQGTKSGVHEVPLFGKGGRNATPGPNCFGGHNGDDVLGFTRLVCEKRWEDAMRWQKYCFWRFSVSDAALSSVSIISSLFTTPHSFNRQGQFTLTVYNTQKHRRRRFLHRCISKICSPSQTRSSHAMERQSIG